MFNSILNAVFGCSHKRTTFPMTSSRRSRLSSERSRNGTYVVCLDCGQEFDYNWKEMRIDTAAATHAPAESLTAVR
jgi:hypothetical protein